MTSRREAVIVQREEKLEAIVHNLRGVNFDIHRSTRELLQQILLDGLIRAENLSLKSFSLSSRLLRCAPAGLDAEVYRSFFARCVGNRWNVSLNSTEGEFTFDFALV